MTSTLDIIKQILVNEMELPKNRVWAYNAAQDLPKDKNLFIVLSFGEKKTISNNIEYKTTKDGVDEIQSANVAEDVIISLLSVNNDARDRTQDVFLALNSTFSRNAQEKNKMHFTTTGSAFDASFLEETSRINRFDIKISVFRGYAKIKQVDYYDKFPNTGTFEPKYLIES